VQISLQASHGFVNSRSNFGGIDSWLRGASPFYELPGWIREADGAIRVLSSRAESEIKV